MTKLRVVIVGGGIGGLVAAIALQSRGALVQVYEQAHKLGDVGAGVVLAPNSLRVLSRLGINDRLARVGVRLTDLQSRRADGTVMSSETYSIPGNMRLSLHRADLVTALAESLPQEVIHTGYQCVGLEQDDHHIVVTFANGVSTEADVVVAADGIHSTLQRYVVEPREPVFSGVMAYRGVIPVQRVSEWPRDAGRRSMQRTNGTVRNYLSAGRSLSLNSIKQVHSSMMLKDIGMSLDTSLFLQ